MKKEYFKNIDGLRTISCIAIIMMHVKANTSYSINGIFFNNVINSFTWLVYLFLMISGFGICAGYLDKFTNDEINLEKFYFKRYKKILPFFIFLILINIVYEFSSENIYDALMETTLLYGFLPNLELNVIGVSWTLGIIFLFYIFFPFLSVFLKTKKKAWFSLIISLILNYLCENYYFSSNFVTSTFTARHNFLYCLPIFIAGCLIYLYRNDLKKMLNNKKIYYLIFLILLIIGYYIIPNNILNLNIHFYKCFIICAFILIYSISFKSVVLNNKATTFIGKISMEMYLAQMIIFRLIEKMGILYIFGSNYISLIMAYILLIILLVIFIKMFYYFFNKLKGMKLKNEL